jgi:hypothetical protein
VNISCPSSPIDILVCVCVCVCKISWQCFQLIFSVINGGFQEVPYGGNVTLRLLK